MCCASTSSALKYCKNSLWAAGEGRQGGKREASCRRGTGICVCHAYSHLAKVARQSKHTRGYYVSRCNIPALKIFLGKTTEEQLTATHKPVCSMSHAQKIVVSKSSSQIKLTSYMLSALQPSDCLHPTKDKFVIIHHYVLIVLYEHINT